MHRKKVLDVPKIKQLKNHCGPASLAMVFQYHGLNITQEEVAEYWGREYVSQAGVYYFTLVNCARHFGFSASAREHLTLEKVIKTIESVLPIIARVRVEGEISTHSCVIRGYERYPSILWINDPNKISKKNELYKNFSQLWNIRDYCATHNYGVVVKKK